MIFAKEYVRGLGKDSFLISQVQMKELLYRKLTS